MIAAFSCAPRAGSEPGVGWGLASSLARDHEVTVLTDFRNRREIQAWCAEIPPESLEFVYVRSPVPSRLRGGYLEWAYYAMWLWRSYLVARQLERKRHFDLVIHATYVNSWVPPLWGWLNARFVWLAGTRQHMNWRFIGQMSSRQAVRECIRNLVLLTFGQISKQVARKPGTLVITSSDQRSWGEGTCCVRMPIGGLHEQELQMLTRTRSNVNGDVFRVASIGRLLGLKGFAIGLRSFALLKKHFPQSEYWIVGDGPEKKFLQRLAQKLDIQHAVQFLPWQSRNEVFEIFERVDVLLHPSLHEQFGYVILEAMAAGKPVVCLDTGGPSVIVSKDVGFKVEVNSVTQVVNDIANALIALANDVGLRSRMGKAARAHAVDWRWEEVTKRILKHIENTA